MTRKSLLLAALAGMFASVWLSSPTAAQALHAWVASNGNDAANCDRSTPCLTFQGAYNKTNAGGEITCVDSSNYGGLTIAKSITINCESAIASSNVIASNGSFNPIVVNTAVSDVVTLRGLDLDGENLSVPGVSLIQFTGAGMLNVEKVKISNLRGNSHGIQFALNGSARLYVADCDIVNNGASGATAGIIIKSFAGLTATVSIERSRINNNNFGIIADATGGGAIRGLVRDSFIAGNTNSGITAQTSGAPVVLMIDNTSLVNNNYGIIAAGGGVVALVRRSTITTNATGLFSTGGAAITSYGDNALNANTTTDGAFNFTIGLH